MKLYLNINLLSLSVLALASTYGVDTVYGMDITDISIEDLMQTEVTTVSRSEQRFADTAAAVFVISQQDIERSGSTSVQEALRMVPGLQVGRIGSNRWAVGARGLNSRFANKLLVMIDGRAIYTPTFSGTYWELNDMVMEDIERIEVVRGPGSSIWGANAVNGVINIITSNSTNTQGALVSILAGNEEQIASLRYGGEINKDVNYRSYFKYTHRDAQLDQQGNSARDDWQQFRGGFRFDGQLDVNNEWHVMTDVYHADINQSHLVTQSRINSGVELVHNEGEATGASVQALWTHHFSVASKVTTQFYYQYFQRSDYLEDDSRHTLDFDFKHELAYQQIHHIIWGAQYRLSTDRSDPTAIQVTDPRKESLHLFSTFVQDRVQLWDDKLELTLGTKIQYHTYDDWQFLPSAKLLWKVHAQHRLWASVSRSTRTPARTERDVTFRPMQFLPEFPVDWVLTGSPVTSEKVMTYEAGYRTWPFDNFSFDLSFHYAKYKDVIVFQADDFNFINREIILAWDNAEDIDAWGFEVASEWRPLQNLKINLAYNFIKTNLKLRDTSVSLPGVSIDRGDDISPAHQVSLRAGYDFTPDISLDLWYRYVDTVDSITTTLPGIYRSVDSYHAVDLRLAWRPHPQWQLALVGQNLNDSAHSEFIEEAVPLPTQIQRSVYAQIQWTH